MHSLATAVLKTFAVFFCVSVLSSTACDRSPRRRVTLYTSVDEPIAKPIIQSFERETGVHVTIVTDTEASKSVGLAERLRAETSRPQCDVWWGNEPFQTILLSEENLFEPYAPTNIAEIPQRFRDASHRWTGNGLRARVMIVAGGAGASGEPLESRPPTLASFVGPGTAIARPTAGTTGGHVAALYVLWGDERADEFFRRLRDSKVKLLGGNGPVAEAVGNGALLRGLCDNDDVANTRRGGANVEMILPDQRDGEIGTLMIPTTVALVSGRNASDDAKRLVDYLVSRPVEKQLVAAEFAGWSVRGGDGAPRAMDVDYTLVARRLPDAVRRATDILDGRIR